MRETMGFRQPGALRQFLISQRAVLGTEGAKHFQASRQSSDELTIGLIGFVVVQPQDESNVVAMGVLYRPRPASRNNALAMMVC